MTSDKKDCPLCDRPAQRSRLKNDPWGILECRCDRCGVFYIDHDDEEDCLSNQTQREKQHTYRISALTLEQHIQSPPRVPMFLQFRRDEYATVPKASPIYVPELLSSRWPTTVSQRIERSFCNLARMSNSGGAYLEISIGESTALLFAQNKTEATFHYNALLDHDLIKRTADKTSVTAIGWEHFEELQQSAGSPLNPAFVAMWFGDEENKAQMRDAYETAILPALHAAGYEGSRVDLEQYNDFIMDKILAGVREAPFMVADFTGNRHGVYFEAGYARGFTNKPVIHTCRRDFVEDLHFDVQQINCIRWDSPEDLLLALYHRIRGTVGQGPRKFELDDGTVALLDLE